MIKNTIFVKQNRDIMERYEVHIDNDLFKVYDTESYKYVSKGYKYSRYAYNIQYDLEIKYIHN